MSASTLIEQARKEGVTVALDRGGLKLRGDRRAVIRWAAIIREHKPEVLQALAEPVRWWRFIAYLPARTVEVDLAGGATEAEGRERIRELYPDAAMVCPLLAYPTEPKPGKLRVQLRVAGLSIDLDVPDAQGGAMAQEARRWGLVRYRLKGDDGEQLPGFSIEAPRPGEDREACIDRLRREFGGRLQLDGDGGAGEAHRANNE